MNNDKPIEIAEQPSYEAPSIERIVTADELSREAQYAGDTSGADGSAF
jgi:hypothetical protein